MIFSENRLPLFRIMLCCSVAFHHGPAGAAHVVPMLLQAGRNLEFVVEDFLAKPMRVTAAGSFLSGGVRLRPSGAGTSKSDDETKGPKHDLFLMKAAQKTRRARQHSAESGHIETRATRLNINSQNVVSVPCMDTSKSVRVVCAHARPAAIEYA
jgi:hypothetical protein